MSITMKTLNEGFNKRYFLNESKNKKSRRLAERLNSFDSIDFGEKISSYRGEKVSLYIFTEIYQTTNLPQNW